jgi:transposase
VTCRNATGPGRPRTSGCGCGPRTAPGQDPRRVDRQGRRGGRGGVWLIGVDSSVVRAHQHAAGARKRGLHGHRRCARGRGRRARTLPRRTEHQDPPRRGPARAAPTRPAYPGTGRDNPQLLPLLDGIRVARVGPGRPRSRPEMVIADMAYSHPSTRQALGDRKIRLLSPERDDHIARRAARGSRGGRPPAFDAERYKQRNVIERCSNRLNSSATWPPATPNEPPTTTPNSPSPRSFSGSDELQDTP